MWGLEKARLLAPELPILPAATYFYIDACLGSAKKFQLPELTLLKPILSA